MVELGFVLIGAGIGGISAYIHLNKRNIVLDNELLKVLKKIKHII